MILLSNMNFQIFKKMKINVLKGCEANSRKYFMKMILILFKTLELVWGLSLNAITHNKMCLKNKIY